MDLEDDVAVALAFARGERVGLRGDLLQVAQHNVGSVHTQKDVDQLGRPDVGEKVQFQRPVVLPLLELLKTSFFFLLLFVCLLE